jgi:adenosylcobinamide-GDP ribazoletransferase
MIISLSLYSKIPMPTFEWDEKNYKHAIAFLPLVGIIIGYVSSLAVLLMDNLELPELVITIVLTLIPLIITGGFHLDGFMDVKDAFHSYQDREKKLQIMKDPHIGAFAVIGAGMLLLVWVGSAYLMVRKAFDSRMTAVLDVYYASFGLVRAFCGITSIAFPHAKEDGMLSMETKKSGAPDIIILTVFAAASGAYMVYKNINFGLAAIIVLAVFSFWYKGKCKKEFGGVTGDTAGFYVVAGEAVVLVALAILSAVIL